MKIGKFEIPNLILLGDSAELFVAALPHYNNAYTRWVASSKGMTEQDLKRLGDLTGTAQEVRQRYEDKQKEYQANPSPELEEEVKSLEKRIGDLSIKLTQDESVRKVSYGLTEEEMKLVDQNGEILKEIRNNIIKYICDGIYDDKDKKVLDYEKVISQMTRGQKDSLIWHVSNEDENAIPLDFLRVLSQTVNPSV